VPHPNDSGISGITLSHEDDYLNDAKISLKVLIVF